MKILWFYKYDHAYNMDFWLHEGFMQACDRFPGVESFIYGPRMHEVPENGCKVKYDSNYSIHELTNIFKPDVIICNTKSRMFDYYSPPSRGNEARGCILPKDFKTCKVPTILLEEDYHYEIDDTWYQETGFDLILQRHCSQVARENKVKMKWLPFSVDLDIFKPQNRNRQNKVGFAGSITFPYPDRIFAVAELKKHGLIDAFISREKIGNNYIDFLQDYQVYLSGASAYNITAAKNFEIMASGGVLLTNNFTGLTDLFPKDCYVLWDEKTLISNTKKLLTEKAFRDNIVDKALKVINEKHSHFIRIQELINIIKENL